VDLGPWLEQLRLARPRGAITVHHLDSADTFGWSCNQFRREVFGVPAARAFLGICVAIAGSLMTYSGAEQGMEEFTRSLLALKRALPALDRGDVDYLAVRADDRRVFATLRTLDGQAVIPVVNVADRLSTAVLALDPAVLPVRGAAFRVVDRLDGTVLLGPSGPAWRKEELGAIVVPLSPFQVRVLEIVPAA